MANLKRRIPSIGPSITRKEISLVREAVATGWYGRMSAHIEQFTEEFRKHIGLRYCLPVSHGTAAIHLALLGLRLKAGDEVIVPDITWVASAAPILYVGATPVFVDVEPDTLCISPTALKKAISRRTKAIVMVDLLGNMPQVDRIKAIADAYGIPIIEDAAEALGSRYKNKPAGSLAKIGVFSFNATKLVIGAQGGMLATDDRRLYERAKLLSHHGIDKRPGARYYWSSALGFNYNWTNIQAALALAQLRRLDELLRKKRRLYRWYARELKDVAYLRLNQTTPNSESNYWLITAFQTGPKRRHKEALQKGFSRYGIDARPFFYPLSSMPPYRRFAPASVAKSNRVSYDLSRFGICLPSGMNTTRTDVKFICRAFKALLAEK